MPRLAICDVGNGAGVDHEGCRSPHGPVDDAYALAGEAAGERLGVGLVEFAAERQNGDCRWGVRRLGHSDMIGVGARPRPTVGGAGGAGSAAAVGEAADGAGGAAFAEDERPGAIRAARLLKEPEP